MSNDADDALSSSSSTDNENNGECENGAGECHEDGNEVDTLPLTRRRPKLGSYTKKAGTVVAEASVEKYQQRKLIELEEAVTSFSTMHSARSRLTGNTVLTPWRAASEALMR